MQKIKFVFHKFISNYTIFDKYFKIIISMLQNINSIKVLIVGDAMLDIYDWGKVERISPEAPVPIFNLSNTEYRFGGAANVAINIKKMGAQPILCSVIGNDISGNIFLDLLKKNELSTEGILKLNSRPTTTKRRIIAHSQHILRIDDEVDTNIEAFENDSLMAIITSLLDTCNIVIFEDYDKGVISSSMIDKIVAICNQKNIPTSVDPKKRNFLHYKNVTLFKPNLKELKEGLKIDFDNTDLAQISEALQLLDSKLGVQNYLITLSENGVLLHSKGISQHIPAHIREIADVSGAGDTVIAVASIFLALGHTPFVAASMANLAGGLVCEHVGAVPIDLQVLLLEAAKNNILN